MSKIDELIEKLCPNGVPYKKIKDVYSRVKGTPITAGKMHKIENENGEIKIFAGGKTIIDAQEKDIPKANITRVPAVIVQSRGIIDFIYYDKPFTFKNEMWAYTSNNNVSTKFLYYVLKNNVEHFRDAASGMGSMPQISLSVTEEFVVPVPPLEVQCEIVHILDDFTLLSAELSAELKARKKQYKYYLHKLLDKENGTEMTIGDIYDFKYGTGNTIPEGGGEYPIYGSNGIVGYYSEYNSENSPVIGHIGAYAGIVNWASGKHFVTYNGVICKHKNPNVNAKYAYYVLLTQDFIGEQKGAQPFVSYDTLKKPKVNIPSLEEQEKIVSILDRFDSICNDISEGLPAEIEARKKQYEYYRDKLLTFKELVNEG